MIYNQYSCELKIYIRLDIPIQDTLYNIVATLS